ncbi:Hypothetical predicted protein, partial [Pelobates cultripes]
KVPFHSELTLHIRMERNFAAGPIRKGNIQEGKLIETMKKGNTPYRAPRIERAGMDK